MPSNVLVRLAAAAAVFGAAASPAHAALSRACPGVEDHLQAALFKVVQAEGSAATMTVRVTLRGQRITAVSSDGGPERYQRALRRALLNLHCASADRAAQQTVDFGVRFVDPWGRGAAAAEARIAQQ